jgi:hypothetical protein
MSGCDYLPSIKGMGIRKAVKYMHNLGNINYVISKMKNDIFKDVIPKDYLKVISTIRLIFLY